MGDTQDPFTETIEDWLITRVASALNIRNKATQENFKKKLLNKEENK